MQNINNKEPYLLRKAEQLHQWERVIDQIATRAENATDKSKLDLLHHLEKIKEKKAEIETQLRQLRDGESGRWERQKADLEKNWLELRDAFSKASTRSQEK